MFGIGRVQREFAFIIKGKRDTLNDLMGTSYGRSDSVTIGNQRYVGTKQQVLEVIRNAVMLADRPDITIIYPYDFEFSSVVTDVVAKAPNDLYGNLFSYGYDVNMIVNMELHKYMFVKYGSDVEYDLKFIKYNDLGRLTFTALVKPDPAVKEWKKKLRNLKKAKHLSDGLEQYAKIIAKRAKYKGITNDDEFATILDEVFESYKKIIPFGFFKEQKQQITARALTLYSKMW